jgi:hypothetical protein
MILVYVLLANLRLTISFKDFHVKATIIFVVLSLCSVQLFAKESFMNFDFIDGKIENGASPWYYSDVGEAPCNVYDGSSQSKLCNPNGQKIYAYYNGANNSHIGWLRYGYIDSSRDYAVSNSSLKLQMTGGVYKSSNGSLVTIGVPAKSKSEYSALSPVEQDNAPKTLPGDMSIYVKTATNTTKFTQFQGKNRFSVWVLMPYRSLDINEYSTANKQKPDQRLSWYPFIYTSRGSHYYHHASNIPMGGWTKVQFDAHPTHHNSGSKNAYSSFSAGGYEFPGKPTSYFDNIATFALRTKFSIEQPIETEFYFDEFEVDYVEFENEETINNIGVGFNPETKQFDISFEDKYRCLKCTATYVLKYSFNPITNLNFEDAYTPSYITNFNRSKNNKNGKIYKPNPGYNLLWAAINLQEEHKTQLTDGRKIYFAVKDISSRQNMTPRDIDSETVNVPGLGEIKHKDLIKTIEYKIIPVNYPLEFETALFNEAVAGQKFSQKIKSYGGTKPYTYSATNLPNGLKLNNEGTLSGIPLNKGNNEVTLTVIDAKNEIINRNVFLEVLTPKDFNVEHCKLIVDFKSNKNESILPDFRFNQIFMDKYTGYKGVGTTIRLGSNRDYDYQGVKGSGFELFPGDKIRLTWKNVGSKAIDFSPRISFTKQGRYIYNEKSQWLYSSKLQVEPSQFGTSELVVKSPVESSFININVNKSNNQTLILDKIELVEQANSSSDLCERMFSTPTTISKNIVKNHLVVDFQKTITESQTGLANLNKIINDKYTGFWGDGMTTIIGSNGNYNFQGVTGTGYELIEGDQILLTWINESNNNLDFTPLLSLKSTTRIINSNIDEWHKLDNLMLNAHSTATSKFDVTKELAGQVNVINISNGINLNKTLILDKIELISTHEPFVITNNNTIAGTQRQLLTHQLTTNNYESEAFFETNSYMPVGLFLSSEGMLEGTPEEYGQFEIQVQAFVNNDLKTSKKIDIVIASENSLNANRCNVLVDFNGYDNNHVIESSSFHSVIHDIYTGPAAGVGLTNRIGSHKDYNYQGIIGEFSPQSPANKIRTVWYNNSEALIEFSPRISFSNFGRVTRNDPSYDWSTMEKISISPKTYMVANFNLNNYAGSIYDGINVNVNYTNNQQLILDKIEYVNINTPESQTCELPQS